MYAKITFIYFLFCILISVALAAKLLAILPDPDVNQFTYSNMVLKSLAERGHEISVISQSPVSISKEKYTSVTELISEHSTFIDSSIENNIKKTWQEYFEFSSKLELSFCEKVLHSKQIQDALKSKEKIFDVIIVQIFFIPRCYYWIAQKLDIPIIGLVTLRSWILADWDLANPRHPALSPFEFGKKLNPKKFLIRLENTVDMTKVIYQWYTTIRNVHVQFYENNLKNMDDISYDEFIGNKPSLIMVNSHSSYFPRPMNPNMIEIGGIHIEENQALSKEIQTFLDGAEHGAILFTFGSTIEMAKSKYEYIQSFKEAFSQIRQKIIWKYEDELQVPDNVMLLKWLPQQDILAHKNIRAFISHCDQQAVHESIHYKVPLIACPLFGDQHINANILENLEAAAHLNYESITKETILKAIHEVINDTKYLENIKSLSYSFDDRPMTPRQTVIYWTDYVIRHKGAPHLVSPAFELNWFQYFLLDIIGTVILFYCIMSIINYTICKLFYTYVILRIVKIVRRNDYYNLITWKNRHAKHDNSEEHSLERIQ